MRGQRIVAGAATMALLGGALAAGAAPATASSAGVGQAPAVAVAEPETIEAESATTCQSRVATFSSGGEVVAVLCQGDKLNRFSLQSRGSLRGVTKFMKIRGCAGDSRDPRQTCREDKGMFAYYAGPITIGGCLIFDVKMNDGRGNTVVDRTVRSCN